MAHVTRGGVNVYLTPSVKARPIQVTGSKGIHGTVFSEFALAAIFMLAKKLPECIEAQREKKWQKFQPIEVEGKTVGIVGLGTVGDELARKAKALGMRVLATKRTAAAKPDYVDELGTPEFLPRLLAESDYVVLLLASVPSTFNIISEKELPMKPSPISSINRRPRRRGKLPCARQRKMVCRRRGRFRQTAAAGRPGTLELAQRHHTRIAGITVCGPGAARIQGNLRPSWRACAMW
jgi:hypothetical protein